MKKRTEIGAILKGQVALDTPVVVMGWVRAFRNSQFIALNDGSSLGTVQIVINSDIADAETIKRITFGAAICVEGQLIASQGKGQTVEVIATSVEIFGDSDPSVFPLQPKKQTLEFLRGIAHLRPRTSTFGAVLRLRHHTAYAIHKFFNDKGFFYLHAPIITASDAEGAGEMFRVTTLDAKNPPLTNEDIDSWASRYYDDIKNAIKTVGLDINTIDKQIMSINKDLNLKHLVTATPAEIREIRDAEFRKDLDKVIKNIYTKIKPILFDRKVKNEREYHYLPQWLFDELKSKKLELQIKQKQIDLILRFENTIENFGHALTLSLYNILWVERFNKLSKKSQIDVSKDFFGRATNLTVSGQLEGELAAMALSKIYTFGPTFRAENSNTSRHLAEFWMIEPEVAFADLEDNMDLAEAMLKYCIQYCLDNCREDLEFLAGRLVEEEKQKPQAERSEMGLIEKLEFVLANPFERLNYTDAVEILVNSNHNKKGKFKFPIEWGTDLQSEHERYLVEKHFKKPVILINYPKHIKAFYMRQNDDGKTVAAMDVLFPGIGEIIGGSQREERLDKLTTRMAEMHIPEEEMYWFLDTRRFGTCPHAGYGLGFERLVQFVSGMGNIRDVIPFPRYPGSAEF